MNARTLRSALGRLLAAGASTAPEVVVQHLGFDAAEAQVLSRLLAGVGHDLGLRLVADEVQGELVLVAEGFAERVSPAVMVAFLSERPMLRIDRALLADPEAARRVLVPSLAEHLGPRASAAPRAAARGDGYDSGFDSTLQADRLADADMDADRSDLLERLRRGLVDPAQPTLVAGYGPGAMLAIDFAVGVARMDEAADQRLRAGHELPRTGLVGQPGPRARERELDLVCWDMAMAAGSHRLLRAPVTWWRTALVAPAQLNVARYTMQPRHLAMARALAREPLTPAQLFRQCRVPLADLRGFIQACLFLGLAQWVDPSGG